MYEFNLLCGGDLLKLDTFSWLTAFQADSILASYNSDCLQEIFSRLSLHDALHLGRACRRLYAHFEKSQKTTKALVITRGEPNGLEQRKTVFLRNINCAARDAVEEEVPEVKLTPVRLPFLNGVSLLTFTLKFTETFSNLRLLEVATRLNRTEWEQLLTQLSPASLPLLTSLKLYPEFYDFMDSRFTATEASRNFWAPLYQRLRHPALRHLTLNILNRFVPQRELNVSPRLPILQQLTSFSFFSRQSMPALLGLIREFTRPPTGADAAATAHPTLTPGEGARFGLQLFKEMSAVKAVPLIPSLLAYITYLDLQIGWYISNPQQEIALRASMKNFLNALMRMRHLQKLDLTIGRDGEGLTAYPILLVALSQLEHLHVLSVDCLQNPLYGDGLSRVWPRSEMRVLPSVRFFSLALSTSVHADVVEQFHLAHCFPGMRLIKVHFKQDSCSDLFCSIFSASSDRLTKYQACGRELTRGLLVLKLSQTEMLEKEVTFTFGGSHRFSSLEKLLAGIED